jgi:dimethylglycine dehydrogenase
MSTVWSGGRIVGEVTTAAYGYRIGASVALAMLKPEVAQPGAKVEIEVYGEMRAATVRGDAPLWDPANERLRA